jgi:hypothetical protein|nr:MAG TPA: hypothetical protein [Caudoviricetes sp.]
MEKDIDNKVVIAKLEEKIDNLQELLSYKVDSIFDKVDTTITLKINDSIGAIRDDINGVIRQLENDYQRQDTKLRVEMLEKINNAERALNKKIDDNKREIFNNRKMIFGIIVAITVMWAFIGIATKLF